MKTSTILFWFFALFFCFSCSTETEMDDRKRQQQQQELSEKTKLKTVNLKLDTAERNKIISNLEQTLSTQMGKTVDFDSYEVIEINDQKFLRAKSGDLISTTLLKEREGTLWSAGITCTTKACSNNDGCIPDENKCTSCLGDCTKTTTGELPGGD